MLFLKNIKKYFRYALYQAKAELKGEVANSYLNWIWWILDPLFFMIIYSFVVEIVFSAKMDYFPVFVLTGLTCWDFFNRMVNGSVKLITNNKDIVSKVYIPKYILLLSKSFVYLFKFFISFSLLVIMVIFYKIPLTFAVLWFIPIVIVLYVLSFGLGLILMHFGVYIDDLSNITQIGLRFIFYLSGIFYDIKKMLTGKFIMNVFPATLVLKLSPIALIINEMREVLIKGNMPNLLWLGIFLLVGIVLTMIGATIIHKYENSYAKVV